MNALLADYDLIERIGAGSYGEVWRACSTATGAVRAVKVVYRSTFNDDRPFNREFEGIKKFEEISRSHPSQLAIFHVGRNDAAHCFYYVMDPQGATWRSIAWEKRSKRSSRGWNGPSALPQSELTTRRRKAGDCPEFPDIEFFVTRAEFRSAETSFAVGSWLGHAPM